METIITHEGPLAGYFEGQAEGTPPTTPHAHPSNFTSFAPPMPHAIRAKFHGFMPDRYRDVLPLRKPLLPTRRYFDQIINGGLGRAQNSHFIEQFRYSIVASQLLEEHSSHSQLPRGSERSSDGSLLQTSQAQQLVDPIDALIIAVGAFLLAWIVNWTRNAPDWLSLLVRIAISLCITTSSLAVLVLHIKRQRHSRQRQEAILLIRHLTSASSDLDRALSSSISMIQEVETVSHGYQLSSPLPPISRLDGISHKRHCTRLRRTCAHAMAETTLVLSTASFNIRPLSDVSDVERYHDVYGLSPADSQDLALGLEPAQFEDQEGLKALRLSLYRLHTIRRLLLCYLLALDADDSASDFDRWEAVLQSLAAAGDTTIRHCALLYSILAEQARLTPLQTPSRSQPAPPRAGSERFRAQVRKLTALSHALRSLQAKMHILREEADLALDRSDDHEEFEGSLVAHYDALGKAIQSLLREWEAGSLGLASGIQRNERRRSLRSPTPLSPMSPLSGSTAVNSSPSARGSPAPRSASAQERKRLSLLSVSSTGTAGGGTGSGEGDAEEVFEAVSMPLARTRGNPGLTREERIGKMQEERERVAVVRERQAATVRMLSELEAVIGVKGRGGVRGKDGGTVA